jgi:superfamily II DNA or RNA helicase
MGFLERKFLIDVFFEDYGENGLDLILPEVEIPRNDGSGRKYRLDFVVQTKNGKYAIECDGFNYHAAGLVSRERFDELEAKRNETIRQGYFLISLSRDQIIEHPDDAIYELRRSINSDPVLSDIFLARNTGRIEPHQVQRIVLEKLDETRNLGFTKGLVVLATGLGKTYAAILDTLQMGAQKILFIVHVDQILKQAKNSFEKANPERASKMGFFTGKERSHEGKEIIFATIQSLSRNENFREFGVEHFDYVIIDESHHVAAPSYQKLVHYFEPSFLLGLTATPDRMDEKSVLSSYDENLVFSMDQSEAIKQGYLSNLRYIGLKDNVDYSNIFFNGFKYDVQDLNRLLMIESRDRAILEKYREFAEGKKTIAFCASIEHADSMSEFFNANGIKSVSLHSRIVDKGRRVNELINADEVITAFETEKIQVVFVVDMFNEGVDIPSVECLLMLRPTESSTVMTQQIGRGLRLSPGKREALVLDFIGNYRSAHKILSGLGLNGLSEFTQDKVKGTYHYNNNGVDVTFDDHVVDIMRFMLSRSSREVDLEKIEEQWIEYGDFLEEMTSEGQNLYWSIGKKNNDLEMHLWCIDFIISNEHKYDRNDELDLALKKAWRENFPHRPSMEGIRALFFSKLIGLIEKTHPFKASPAYSSIQNMFAEKQEEYAKVLISNQIEKFYFYNDIAGLVNRHNEEGQRRQVGELFHIYPIYFLFQVLLSLKSKGYGDIGLTKFEFENFVCVARDHDQLAEITDRIIMFRNHAEKYELEKLIRRKSSMDTRMFKMLHLVQELSVIGEVIRIQGHLEQNLESKVNEFEEILESGQLVRFGVDDNRYRDLLYSDLSLIEYHKD